MKSAINSINSFNKNPLPYPEMYGVYYNIKDKGEVEIDSDSINSATWQNHYDFIINIFKDGIESEIVQKSMIKINFPNHFSVRLSIFDYWFNLIMWKMLVDTESRIMAYHIFFPKAIRQGDIKKWIDEFIIDEFRKTISNVRLNNIIDASSNCFHDIELFSYYLANTINIEDSAFLMDACEEFNECMHADLSNVPLEDVKDIGMDIASKSIKLMKDAKKYLGYDHCLADAWRVGQGINQKQYKDTTIGIGTKPDGKGSIYPTQIINSFINGGVVTPQDYFIESSTGRTAQIIKFINVGNSGGFARILGLNNMGTFLNPNPEYVCGTPNYVKMTIKDDNFLRRLDNRYYRLNKNGVERIIKAKTDSFLIGKTIYLRSPITCASNARGHGICFKCFGDLAYTLFDFENMSSIDPGRMASETMSSALTQKLLSAKHMLESSVEKLVWCDEFNVFFEVEANLININSELSNTKQYAIIIDPDSIELENDEDDDISDNTMIYNEFITEFAVLDKSTGEEYTIKNSVDEKLYLTNRINSIIRKKGTPVDGKIHVDFQDIASDAIFIVPIRNSELSKTLDHLEGLLNKADVVKNLDIDSCAQQTVETAIKGGINISSVYIEVIISNQVRDSEDILEPAKWMNPNPEYRLMTLNTALANNPSVTRSLSYQKIERMLYNPLTLRKHKASFMDLFFMKKPQVVINSNYVNDDEEVKGHDGLIEPMVFVEDADSYTGTKQKD